MPGSSYQVSSSWKQISENIHIYLSNLANFLFSSHNPDKDGICLTSISLAQIYKQQLAKQIRYFFILSKHLLFLGKKLFDKLYFPHSNEAYYPIKVKQKISYQYLTNKIMQVRKYLHNNKAVDNLKKKGKQVLVSARATGKKKTKINEGTGKSRSRSRSEKENTKHRKSQNKSFLKVSPLGLKKSNVLNNSPSIKTNRKKGKSKSKQKNKDSARPMISYREFEKSHLISTKLVTDRSPLKTQKDCSPNPRPSAMKKKKKKQKCKPEKKQSQLPQEAVVFDKKPKKLIPKIKTNFSIRKQSFFDPQILEKLTANEKISHKFSARLHSQNQQTQAKTFRNAAQSLRQYGTSTDDLSATVLNKKADVKDLQFLRKQQQLKWRIMYLQLSEFQNSQTPQKLQEIINQSEKNLCQFQNKTQKIIDNRLLQNNYVFESPIKIQRALRKQRKSIEETKELLKSMSDHRLIIELQKIDPIEVDFVDSPPQQEELQKQSFKEDNPLSSSFCLEFQKELEQFTKKNQPFKSMEISHIPQMQYEKANTVCDLVEVSLLLQICQDLIQNQTILHSFLSYLRENSAPPKIQTSGEYSIELAKGLFEFIFQKDLVLQLLARLNVPFGNSPQVNLKWVRNFFTDDSEDMIELDNTPQPILSTEILSEYDERKYLIPSQGQYFYNHCVYGCVGQLLDYHRPNGLLGLHPLQRNPSKLATNFSQISKKVIDQLTGILNIRMGRSDFDQDLQDPILVTQNIYQTMDKYLVAEQQIKWKSNEDHIFENKYFLAASIIENILNEQIMMIYNEFM